MTAPVNLQDRRPNLLDLLTPGLLTDACLSIVKTEKKDGKTEHELDEMLLVNFYQLAILRFHVIRI